MAIKMFDTSGLAPACLRTVLNFGRRGSALLLTLALATSNVGLCAGWMATREARMACCSESEACPMHKSDSHDSSSKRAVSQAEADTCCAASEQDDSAPSSSSFVSGVSLGVVHGPVPVLLPEASRQTDAWRTSVPVLCSHVPKHLLLSVLLV